MTRSSLAALCLLVVVVACNDGSGPKPLPYCTEVRSVTVAAGTVPTFSWTPACRAGSLSVMRVSSSTDQPAMTVWSISSDSGIAPGVRFGVTPHLATVTHAAEPLSSGILHSVIVSAIHCPPGATRCGNTVGLLEQGLATFTP
jgi:hypothetical protein